MTLGVGVLFCLILVLGTVAVVYINALKSDTENILVANYNSLDYAKNILALSENVNDRNLERMEQHILLQEKNITEPGEKEATENLKSNFYGFKKNPKDTVLLIELKRNAFSIMDMNMQAIQMKSTTAKKTAGNAVSWIAITSAICFLIAFTMLINLPSNIANPIREITASIQQIAEKNYSQRVHFDSHNEFGQLAKSFNTMAQKLEEYNSSNLAKLMMEKKRIETLINNMHDPVFGLDEHLKFIFVNEEATKMTGLSIAELVGRSAQEIAVHNDLVRSLIQDLLVAESSSGMKPKSMKIYANNKEGYFEKETLAITIAPTGEEKKQLIGHVILLRNITEYKELDFAKTNFIATVSHEFKTPISSIKMSLQLLENEQIGKLNQEQVNLVSNIKEDTNRLLKITGELLNMTQVESGNIQLSILPTDPLEIISNAMLATKTQADQKQIKVELNVADNLPKVYADNEKTTWVLTNLISNAIRYSYDNSTIYLSISGMENRVRIAVKDTGQGIAPQYKDKVFDRYFRVPGTKKEGTGLGLAISKEFMEAQGGNITVESEFGEGSTFTILLNSVD